MGWLLREKQPAPVTPVEMDETWRKIRRMSAQPYAAEDFLVVSRIGRGSFGEVVVAVQQNSTRLVAVKILDKEKVCEAKLVEETRFEREVLSKINHPFINRIRLAFQTSTRLYLGTPYYVGHSLKDHVGTSCDLKSARFYAAEIALAIGFLHTKGVVHRDLKPSNVLVDAQGHVAVTDFGLCGRRGDIAHGFSGTIDYVAPELLMTDHPNLSAAVDYWSLGVLLFELVVGNTPFDAPKARDLFQNILHADPPRTFHYTLDKLLTSQLLEKSPSKRCKDLRPLKQSAFFKGLNWDQLKAKAIKPPSTPKLPHYVQRDNGTHLDPEAKIRLKPLQDPDDDTNKENPFSTAFTGFAYRQENH